MPYITTNHRFIIDEKHPADVFDEMEQFFSLYTVAIDDLQNVSVQLSVPPNFDLTANKKLAESYRQFTKSLKYTIPDIHILPIKIAEPNPNHTADAGENNNETFDGHTLTLLIQRLDSDALAEDEKPSLYQSVLGKLLPRFGGKKSDTGYFPEREQISIVTPLPPVQPIQPPVVQTVPSQNPPAYQMTQPTYQPPVTQPVAQPTQYQQPPIQQTPLYQNSSLQHSMQNTGQTRPPAQNLQRLPNIAKSAKPYQDILTHAIINEAKKQAGVLNNQSVSQITLKSNDSLTTAMIEQLFNSFTHAHEQDAPHDAIDLVSYGFEVLKPKLAEVGVTVADDAQFALKTNAKAMPADTARLQRGSVFANEINLRVSLKNNTHSPTLQTAQASQHATTTPTASSATNFNTNFNTNANPNLNRNSQNIRLLLNVSDPLGERQQKVNQFPLQFVSSDMPTHSPNASGTQVRLFGAGQGHFFDIVELDGNVLLGSIEPSVMISRHHQRLASQAILMPNDVLTIDHQGKIVTITLTLP